MAKVKQVKVIIKFGNTVIEEFVANDGISPDDVAEDILNHGTTNKWW